MRAGEGGPVGSGEAAAAYAIIAGTLYGNRGAQAMTETVIGWLHDQQPHARFHVFSYYPEQDRQRLRADATHVRIWSATPRAVVLLFLASLVFGPAARLLGSGVLRVAPAPIRALARSRALLDVAGVSFIAGRERFLPYNILTLAPAWLLGVPVVKLPQAVGPFGPRVNRVAARLVLPRLRVLWARGEQTLAHVRASGIAGIPLAAGDDLGFAHRDAYSLTDEPGAPALTVTLGAIAARRAEPGVRAVVGLCPSSVVAVRSRASGGDYEAVLARMVADLSGAGIQVVLFPNATRAGDLVGERNNDLPVIRRVLAGAGSPSPIAVDVDVNAAAVKAVIAACDVVLVSRFHAMVGALAQAVPVVVLGWSHKYAEVMARFGQQHRVSDYSAVSRDDLVAAVEDALADTAGIAAAIRAGLPGVRAGATRALAALVRDDLGAADVG